MSRPLTPEQQRLKSLVSALRADADVFYLGNELDGVLTYDDINIVNKLDAIIKSVYSTDSQKGG